MRKTLWMAILIGAGALYAGATMAADTAEVKEQPLQQGTAKPGQSRAMAGSDSEACPVHDKKNSGQKNALGKDGEHCSCPHDMMHMHHLKHMSKHDTMHGGKQEACDPAKEAAKPAKPIS